MPKTNPLILKAAEAEINRRILRGELLLPDVVEENLNANLDCQRIESTTGLWSKKTDGVCSTWTHPGEAKGGDAVKNCDKCERYFDQLKEGSPCGKCIMAKWGAGFKRASIPTRIKILERRLKMLLER